MKRCDIADETFLFIEYDGEETDLTDLVDLFEAFSESKFIFLGHGSDVCDLTYMK